MFTKPIAIAGLAVAVIAAAGAGAYLAVRQNAVSLQPAASRLTPDMSEVDMTEAVVSNVTPAEPLEPATAVPATSTPEPVAAAESAATPAASPGAIEPAAPSVPVEPARPPVPTEPKVTPAAADTSSSAEAAAQATSTNAPVGSAPDRTATTAAASTSAPVGSAPDGTATTAAASTNAPVGSAPDRTATTAAASTSAPVGSAPDGTATTAADPPPVQTASVDLPAIDGWSRPEDATNRDAPATLEPVAAGPTGTSLVETAATGDAAPVFIEYELAADSVIGLQVDTAVSTRTARVEDPVEARVTRNVLVGDQVAVPAGARMLGSVVLVEQGGQLKDASRLGVRFHTLVMDGGPRLPVLTETIYRTGQPEGRDSVAKIGGAAVGGAILGAIFGGSRGAAIGGSIGAAGGTAAALNNDAEPATLPPGTMLTVRLSQPVIVTVEP